MKKTIYQRPQMDIMEIDITEMIAASLGIDELGTDENEIITGNSRNRRGTWGNLWHEE